jgi:hypothetical protein
MLQERPGFNEDGTPIQLTKRKKAALVADKVIVQGVLGNTVGRVGRLAGRLLLGRIPDTAKEGSFQEERLDAAALPTSKFLDVINEEDQSLLEDEIFDQVFAKGNKTPADSAPNLEREWKVGEPEKQKELSTV